MGRRAVPARFLFVNEFEFGGRKLFNIKLPAVDLSMTKLFCGKQFDGVLGTDLLTKLDVRIDFATSVAIVPAPMQDVERGIRKELHQWEEAFNDGDMAHFKEVFASDIIWDTSRLRFQGRDAVIAYLQREYFERHARMKGGHIEVIRLPADLKSYQIRWEYKVNAGDGWKDDSATTIVNWRDKEVEILSVSEQAASSDHADP